MRTLVSCTAALVLVACGTQDSRRDPKPPPSTLASATSPATASIAPTASAPMPTAPATPTLAFAAPRGVALPNVTSPAFLDYIAYEPDADRVWVPVGNDGSVDVYDIAKATFTHVAGFAKVEREAKGKKRIMGPSAASVGDGFVYIGNRGSSEVCPVDVKTLKREACTKTKDAIDGVCYVPAAKEVWVSTPEAHAIVVLDAITPKALQNKAIVHFDGSPEGYAVDAQHGTFLTNLEDADKTVVVDVATHTVKHVWAATCGSDGPRGIAVDSARDLVFVACTDHVQVLDGAHDGAPLGKLDVGAGIDNVQWLESEHLLYVAAGKAGKMMVLQSSDHGELGAVATLATSEGARNAVTDAKGNAYLADGPHAQLLVVARSAP